MNKSTEIDAFLSNVLDDSFITEIAKRVEIPKLEAQTLIHTYANEAKLGYTLLQSYLDHNKRLLEVGAGIGILSSYLILSGYKVTAIEPSGTGFELNYIIGLEIYRLLGVDTTSFVNVGICDLNKITQKQFDLIYSVNVLEHIPNLDLAFQDMQSVLGVNGLMLHTCPNYHFPYEPHFGVMLAPIFPLLSKFLLPKKIIDTGLWQSLNFITSTEVKRICRRQGLLIKFEPEVMYRSVIRIGKDPIFAKRHQGIVNNIYHFLSITGLIHVLKVWPQIFSTPMIFVCHPK